MKKYIGLTIGPIYRTIQSSRKTGELWGSSYIFSYIMKQIISKLKANNKNFIVPYIDDSTLFNSGNKVGLFHDRLIFKVDNDDDFNLVKNVVEDVIRDLAYKITIDFNNNKINGQTYNKQDVEKFIKDYFQIHYVEVELKDSDNPIIEVSKVLDAIELRQTFIPKIKQGENYLRNFLKNDIIKRSFLAEDAYGKEEFKLRSIEEIANTEFNGENKENIGEKKKVHNYIAIVQADGDNMGRLIKQIWENGGEEQLKKFSKNLLDFSREAAKLIEGYGGMNIFAGGDDLLFLAPVINGNKNIFDLLDEINKCFEKKFEEIKNRMESNFTLSFGVSITYHKYPLYESLISVRELLFGHAKNNKNKNAIAFKVIKHSGHHFGDTLSKYGKVYDTLKALLNNKIAEPQFLRALHHKISKDKCILINILDDEQKLKNYFDNNFNEDIHRSKAISQYLMDVQKLIQLTYQDLKHNYQNKKELNDKVIDSIHVYLRLIKFMNEAGTDDE